MSHRPALENLGRRLDGELAKRQTRHVDAHLGACPECRRELELLDKLNRMMRALAPPPREADYWASFAGRVRAALERARG